MSTLAQRNAAKKAREAKAAKAANGNKPATRTRKGSTTASAKKVESKPELLTASIEASVIVPIPLVRGKFDKDGKLQSAEPRSTGGVCFSEVEENGEQAKEPVLRQVYISQAQDAEAGNPVAVTLLLVVA